MIDGIRRWGGLSVLAWRTSPSRCLVVLATLLVDIVAYPVVALMLRDFTNAALDGESATALRCAGVAAVTWALSQQGDSVRNLLINDVRERVALILDEEILGLLGDMPGIRHFEDPEALDRIDIVVGRGQKVADTLWSAAETVSKVLSVIATLVVMAAVSPVLMLTLPLALPTLWLNRLGQARIRRALDEAAEDQRTADRLLEVAFDPAAAVELRVSGAGPMLFDEYEARWRRATRAQIRARIQSAALLVVGWLVFLAGFAGALAYIVWQIAEGGSSAGDIILMLAIARQLQQLVQGTVYGFTRLIEGTQVAQAYAWLRARAGEADRAGRDATVPERLDEGIALDHVGFAYQDGARPALRDVSLRLPAGSMVALVGSHGSGKSTLVKLLTQMYEPTEGTISVEGTALNAIDPEGWRGRTSGGFQDFVRFQTTLRESVAVGDLAGADAERVEWALDEADARGLVQRLADGLDTRLGTVMGGVDLSGGQWQKVALARSYMRRDPLLVVLDEPTAALDPVSEHEVFQRQVTLARTMGEAHGTITVVVSHRFSTVRMADLIVVLDGGQVVEQGDHDALMAAGGTYARLYDLQRSAYTTV